MNDNLIEYKKEYQDIETIFAELKHLTIRKPVKRKIDVYFEDAECAYFFKVLASGEYKKQLKLHEDLNLDCNNYKKLLRKGFFPDAIIVLDGDANENEFSEYKNVIFLPGKKNPENMISDFLENIASKEDEFWRNEEHYIPSTFLSGREIDNDDRKKMKRWFKREHKKWGRNGQRLANAWKRIRPPEVKEINERIGIAIGSILEK